MKPEILTQLKKGVAIGAPANMGFTETFNWLVRFCRNLKGDGHWLSVDNPNGDDPTITIGDNHFDDMGGGACDCELTPTLEEGTKIAEWTKGGETVDIYAPEGGELTPYITQGTKIATWSKDGVDTDIYAPNGGGECSCEMEATAPHYDKDAEGHTQQYWENAEVGKFTDCDGNETTLYAPNHVQFKGNVGSVKWGNMNNAFEFVSASDSNIQIKSEGNKITLGCYYV